MNNNGNEYKYRIAHFGTFDLKSLGDTMFPRVYKLEMEKRFGEDIRVDFYSPTNVYCGYNQLGHIYSIDDMEKNHNERKYDLLVIGGGEFVHYVDVEYYNAIGEKVVRAPGALWKKPQAIAESLSIPTIWNCIGVSYNVLTSEQQNEIAYYAKQAIYVTCRDIYSTFRLKKQCGVPAKTVTDMLWLISRYFSVEKLKEIRRKIADKNEFLNKKYLVLQYGTSYKKELVCENIKKISEKYKMEVVLLTVNYCHEDNALVNWFYEQNRGFHMISQELQPEEIISIIQGAEFFVGTSFHGNLVAISYGVKCLILDMYPTFVSKMDGLVNSIFEPELLSSVENMQQSLEYAISISDNQIINRNKNVIKQQQQLDEHFDVIANLIKKNNGIVSNKEKYISYNLLFKGKLEFCQDEISNNKTQYLMEKPVSNNGEFVKFTYLVKSSVKKFKHYISEGLPFLVKDIKVLLNGNDANYTGSFNYDYEIAEPVHEFVFETEKEILNGQLDIIYTISFDYRKIYSTFSNKIENYKHKLFEENCEHRNILEKRDQEIQKRDQEIKERDQEIQKRDQEIKERDQEIQKRDQEIKERDQEIQKRDQEIKERDQEIQKRDQEIKEKKILLNNKNGHIEQLLEQERAYMNLLNTKGVRALKVWWRFKDWLVPPNSKRRFIAKLIKKFLRHPIYMLKKCTPKRIARTLKYMKTEDGASMSNRLDAATIDVNSDIEREVLELFPVNENICTINDVEKLHFEKYNTPLVSIVIPVYNQIHYTYNCLKSILKNTNNIDYEVILADDGSTDLTKDIQDFVDNIVVVKNKENLRFLKNCNNAAKYAKGKYIFFLNNDTQVQENWLSSLVELIEKDDSIGMVGSKLLYPDGLLQEAGGILWKDGSAWNYGNRKSPMDSEYNYVKEVDYISGAAIMIRKSLWEEIGGFDERFAPAYCEDSDLAFEVRKHGYKVVYQPLSKVVHFEGVSNGTDTSSGQKQYQITNQKKFYDKWKKILKEEHYPNGENVFVARDRSGDKKHILVIDHYVPQFDKDAGSRTIWQYIKMFIKKGYSVTFLGDNFYKHEPYTTLLQQEGVEVLYGVEYANHYKDWIINNKVDIDFAFLNRPHITEKYIDFLKEKTDIKCIYYGCDLHCLRIRREYEISQNKKLLAEADDWEKREYDIMHKTDVNYYPSIVEVEEIKRKDSSIYAKTFDIYVYETFKNDIEMNFTNRNGLMFVGGFGHPPNEDAVVWFAKNIYPLIRKKLNVNFYVIGSNPTDKVKQLNGNGIVIKGFVSDDELENMYNTCKMAVIPLRFGAGVKGKVIEALYYGIPMVTTSIGIEGIIGAEDFVEVQDDAENIANAVINMYNDNAKLKQTVYQYQQYVKEHCSVDAVWNNVKEDFS